MLLRRRRKNRDSHRRGITLVPLAVAGALAAALLMSGGSAFASDPPEPTPPTESDGQPIDALPPVAGGDVQALKERVPPSFFPGITETLQLSGSLEVYRCRNRRLDRKHLPSGESGPLFGRRTQSGWREHLFSPKPTIGRGTLSLTGTEEPHPWITSPTPVSQWTAVASSITTPMESSSGT